LPAICTLYITIIKEEYVYDAFQEDLAVLNIYFSESTAIGEFEK
jgi:hypothetical protein